jgi:hypothetical protein
MINAAFEFGFKAVFFREIPRGPHFAGELKAVCV